MFSKILNDKSLILKTFKKENMKKITVLCTVLTFSIVTSIAQKKQEAAAPPVMQADHKLSSDPVAITHHEVTVNGQRFGYSATAGTQPVLDKNGKEIASVFYVYYERSDVKDKSTRPLFFSFNGGPGSASVWMNIGFTGPRRLNIDDEGFPVQPYGFQENPYSILDVADILYVCPVGTGFSRITDKSVDPVTFYGVNSDIKYLAEWLNTFVGSHNRWTSPKFLIGESYGTTRVAGLAMELQEKQWMYLNGVVLVSSGGLELNTSPLIRNAFSLPQFTATAWYHKALPPDLQKKDLAEILPEVENFTTNEYIHALIMGGSLTQDQKAAVAAKVSRYSGISPKVVLENNLVLTANFFRKELLRDRGFTVGRLDSRYLGIDKSGAGLESDYEPSLTSWLHSFTPPINDYLRNELEYKTELPYYLFGPIHGGPWDKTNNHVGENLRQAMNENPALHLMVMEGYYDAGAYFNTKYMMWQLDITGKLKDRMEWHGYRSGHMIYLRKEDLKNAMGDLKSFIQKSIPAKGASIKYNDPKG